MHQLRRRRFLTCVGGLGTSIGLSAAGIHFAGLGSAHHGGQSAEESRSDSGRGPELIERRSQALGTLVSIKVLHPRREVAERAVEAAFAELELVENLLSVYRPHSQVSQLNRDRVLLVCEGLDTFATVWVNGHDVSEAIRGAEVTAAVSLVASHPCVREALTLQQRQMGLRGGLVAEGRDIGTAVFPDAECKVFLTASVVERARRRAHDLSQRGLPVPSMADLEQQIAERDERDSSRAVAPLRRADDAEELVTDGLTIDAVIEALVTLFRRRVPEDAWTAPLPAA